jgi:hypothetical protein
LKLLDDLAGRAQAGLSAELEGEATVAVAQEQRHHGLHWLRCLEMVAAWIISRDV